MRLWFLESWFDSKSLIGNKDLWRLKIGGIDHPLNPMATSLGMDEHYSRGGSEYGANRPTVSGEVRNSRRQFMTRENV